MPASQLKQLKASLREKGITGPQKSKKQKKQNGRADLKIKRDAALADIRENLNPFDVKVASRPNKRDVTTAQTMRTAGKGPSQVYGRPGVSKSHGEELRKRSLLLELQGKNKVGGILDRRIGEDDPNMTPEEKSQQRFAREQERKGRKHALFDLDIEEEPAEEDLLTHGGRALGFDGDDDFDAGSLDGFSDDEETGGLLKRKREAVDEILAETAAEPERKKSKAEVMKEVIAKSKLHKYERQQAKEDDDEARELLDKGMGDLKAALFGFQSTLSGRTAPAPKVIESVPVTSNHINPDRAALMDAVIDPDKNYDVQLKKLAQDKRSRVTDRSKTEEERATHAAEKQKEQDQGRLRRMMGETEDDDEEPEEQTRNDDAAEVDEVVDDAEAFGFKSSYVLEKPPGFEDEDEFIIDDDLVAQDSDYDEDALDAESVSDVPTDDEMLKEEEVVADKKNKSSSGANSVSVAASRVSSCPSTYDDIRTLLASDAKNDANTIIRQVRLRYDASLSSSNKAKLEAFAIALVEFLARATSEKEIPPLDAFEAIIRHVQSMSRTFADPIANTFRSHLRQMHKEQRMDAGDVMILTAIGTIYPTSDHFHQVVTPAMTLIARWLGLTRSTSVSDIATGIYLCTLALKYQSFSKRYVPETVRFVAHALNADLTALQRKMLHSNIQTMASLWSSHGAFPEILAPILSTLKSRPQTPKSLIQLLTLSISQSGQARRPLALHNHRPLPIKTSIPKFEENFNPDRHYDPDRERADSARLKKEYKREKKGAVRELRKDANFLAREKLREKREKDRAYEEKYRRIVAEIQGEEGREAKAYDREKRSRKSRN